MKVKDIKKFRQFIDEVIVEYPLYNQAKYFNKIYKMFCDKQRKVNELWC